MADVFEQMYGFRPNLVENYVPIHRDPTTIKTDIRDMAGAEKAFNLENSGFTIDRVKNSQPILLTDFFQELNSQSEKMARYVGFAQVQKDFGKIWKTRIDSSGMTVNTLVRARFGAGKTNLGVSGEEYINHYIADVAGGHSSEDIQGKAMDFSCPKSSQGKIEACLDRKKNAGEIRYWYRMESGWYHFDVD